jgi:hypothetical protein
MRHTIIHVAFPVLLSAVGLFGCGAKNTAGSGGSTSTSTGANTSTGTGSTASTGSGKVYSSYSEGTPPASAQFVEVCGGTGMMSDNDLSSDITLPFPVNFYANTYTTVRISLNGWISFSQFLGSSQSRRGDIMGGPQKLPSFDMAPSAAVFPLWETLSLRDSQGMIGNSHLEPCYGTVGTAPNRSFVVEWNNAFFVDPSVGSGITDNLTFEVALNEADDTVDLLYKTITLEADHMARLPGVTIGVQNEAAAMNGHGGTIATQSMKTPASGLGIRFTPKQ